MGGMKEEMKASAIGFGILKAHEKLWPMAATRALPKVQMRATKKARGKGPPKAHRNALLTWSQKAQAKVEQKASAMAVSSVPQRERAMLQRKERRWKEHPGK